MVGGMAYLPLPYVPHPESDHAEALGLQDRARMPVLVRDEPLLGMVGCSGCGVFFRGEVEAFEHRCGVDG